MARRDAIAFFLIAACVIVVAVAFGAASMVDVVQRAHAHDPGYVGLPVDWQLNFHRPNSVFQRGLYDFHNLLLGIDIAICSFVAILIIFAVWRFRRSRNPAPTPLTHNTPLEIAWTVLPVMVLIAIAIPSFELLYSYNVVPKADLVVKVIGHQWFWEYQYPDKGNIDIQSMTVPDDQLKPEQKADRIFLVDHYAVLPVDTNVLFQVTSGDVVHSFLVSTLGLQKYAVPGRINEIWTHIDREGTFYGQCSQICGLEHAYMPVGIRVVSKPDFDAWVKAQQQNKSARARGETATVLSAR
ncbi:MAG TPA: cytochrome c oxidase subunit II [Methylovirgula sp.]|nr:cytochrome c oxidase subunit II [Methylovirgula sp.]